MVLTSTNTLSVATAGRAEIGTMIIGALGCNLAWGVIDAALYLMGLLEERGRDIRMLRDVRQTATADEADRLITDIMPKSLASVISPGEVSSLRQRVIDLPEPVSGPRLGKPDAVRALAICLWVFVSTFPVVIPFFFTNNVMTALRFSNLVAIVLLFLCGYAFARCTGLRPWRTGLLMVFIGCVLVGVAIALGG